MAENASFLDDRPGDVEDSRLRSRQITRTKDGVAPVLALLLLVAFATSLYQLPVNRVIERRLCREYYAVHNPDAFDRDGGVDESLCKVDEVQQGLAWIQGVSETAWIAGDFAMTIPFGLLAETYGRRKVLWLNLMPRIAMQAWAILVGSTEALPTTAIIGSSFLSLLGGDCVFNSIVWALAADLTDDPSTRAMYFGYMTSVSYVVTLLGPALSSVSMTISLWLPFWTGISLLLAAAFIISRLPPQSLSPEHATSQDTEQAAPLLSSPVLKATTVEMSPFSSVKKRLASLHKIVASRPQGFSLLLLSFFLTSLASADTKLLVQYISKRYGWKFASTGYLLSAKAVVNFTLLAFVIPSLLRSAESSWQHYTPEAVQIASDRLYYRCAVGCLVVSVLGALGIAVAAAIWVLFPALLVYALGSALSVFTLSLLKSLSIAPAATGGAQPVASPETLIFSIVMMTKTLGSLLGAPLVTVLWVRGISLGGAALGLPYFVSATCYMLAILVFRGIKVG